MSQLHFGQVADVALSDRQPLSAGDVLVEPGRLAADVLSRSYLQRRFVDQPKSLYPSVASATSPLAPP